MKKKLLIVFIIFVIVLCLFITKSNNKVVKYKIKDSSNIYSITEKKYKKYTYIEITWNNKVYPINNFDFNEKIDKVYSYTDENYSCLLPLFNGNILTDIMCLKDSTIYNYQLIKGNDEELDSFAASINEYKKIYDINSKENKYNNIITFYDEFDKNISVSTYKGIINNKKDIKLFDRDVYSNKISVYVDKYYISADYNYNYEFDKFYIVDLTNNDLSTIKVKNSISFDSYIQGIVDNKVFLFDPENEIQYEINPAKKTINKISNDYIKYYSNGKWSKISVKQAKKELLFNYNLLDSIYDKYDKVYENDYYYYAIKNNNLYRINKNNKEVRTLLLKLPSDEIMIGDNYIYYLDGDTLYYYSDITSVRKVLTNKEIEFNKDIKYYIY